MSVFTEEARRRLQVAVDRKLHIQRDEGKAANSVLQDRSRTEQIVNAAEAHFTKAHLNVLSAREHLDRVEAALSWRDKSWFPFSKEHKRASAISDDLSKVLSDIDDLWKAVGTKKFSKR